MRRLREQGMQDGAFFAQLLWWCFYITFWGPLVAWPSYVWSRIWPALKEARFLGQPLLPVLPWVPVGLVFLDRYYLAEKAALEAVQKPIIKWPPMVSMGSSAFS